MSTLKADTIVASDGSSPVTLTKQEAAKSLLNYDHPNVTIKSSFNTSSVSDDATAVFTASHTNNYSDTLYYPTTISSVDNGSSRGSAIMGISTATLTPSAMGSSITTSTTKFETVRSSSSASAAASELDRAIAQTFGDLA